MPGRFKNYIKKITPWFSIPEDEVDHLDEIRLVFQLLKDKKNGIMIDVGAHTGGSLWPFAEMGWIVYAFEPDNENRKLLMDVASRWPSVIVDTRAVSDMDGQFLPFYTSHVSSGISGLSKFHASHQQSGLVETITLKSFFNSQDIDQFDFLKIDTEGFDFFVLKGFDWENMDHPHVIMTEFENNKSIPLGYSFTELIEYLKEREYNVLISEWYPIIEYGQKHRWKRFVTDYARITDSDAWGNIIAVKKSYKEKLLILAGKMGRLE